MTGCSPASIMSFAPLFFLFELQMHQILLFACEEFAFAQRAVELTNRRNALNVELDEICLKLPEEAKVFLQPRTRFQFEKCRLVPESIAAEVPNDRLMYPCGICCFQGTPKHRGPDYRCDYINCDPRDYYYFIRKWTFGASGKVGTEHPLPSALKKAKTEETPAERFYRHHKFLFLAVYGIGQ